MWDLLIIGAGPAGCAAAIRARRAGLRVVLLEATRSAHPSPGEALHPGMEALFEALGLRDRVLAAGFLRHHGIWSCWEGPRQFVPFGSDAAGPWLGFQAERKKLQELMLEAALEAGAVLYRPAHPELVLVEDGRVEGVVAAGREFRAVWTADATGRRAWLARALNLVEARCSPKMHVRFGWSDQDDTDANGEPQITATRTGWTWRAPLADRRAAWVRLDLPAANASFPECAGLDMAWRYHAACAGPGYFLLGDAACSLDPSSSHGVLRAIMSAILCAHLIGGHARRRLAESEAVASYREWAQTSFRHDADRMRELYRRHPFANVARLFEDCSAGVQRPGDGP